MLTTREAAEILQVSPRRVQALVAQGELSAKRAGKALLLDEEEVFARSMRPKLKGRPKLGQKNLLSLGSYTLMCRDHEVLELTYDAQHKTVSIDTLKEVEWAPLGTGIAGRPNKHDLAQWISHRYMPALRPDTRVLMAKANVSEPDALMFGALGLNLSDQYWFRPIGSVVSWHEVNFFENPYVSALEAPMHTPDSSTPGALPKRWERRGGENWLVKGSSSAEQREPFDEALATTLAARLMEPDEYVPYTLELGKNGTFRSACQTMADEQTGFVSANELVTWAGISEGRDLLTNYLSALDRLGANDSRKLVSKMMVIDYVMANFDRHRGNFGILRNSETLDGCRVAPLFDNGSGFFSRATLPELRHKSFIYQANPFEVYPLVQVARAPDLSWYDPDMLKDFPNEVREGLSRNPALSAEFVDLSAAHVERHIAIVNELAAERISLISWN